MHMRQWVETNLDPDHEILITGTSSGIGLEYLKEVANYRRKIICVSNEPDKMSAIAKELTSAVQADIENIDIDLSDSKATKELCESFKTRKIGLLINNAGFGLKGRFEENDVQDYIDVIAVNVTAPVIFARAILPQMQTANRGLVIHVASINALLPIPFNQVYTATKAFSLSYASAVSRENKHKQITFQLVLPGTTRTPFHDRQGVDPQNMVMTPDDVVRASVGDITKQVCIPNSGDRMLAKVIPFLPRNTAMDLAAFILKKRLGMA